MFCPMPAYLAFALTVCLWVVITFIILSLGLEVWRVLRRGP